MALVELENYKLMNEISSPTADARLELIIPLTNDLIEEYCGRRFESDTYANERVSAEGGTLYLSNPPVEAIVKLEFLNTVGEWEELEPEHYLLSPDEGMVELLGCPVHKNIGKPFRVTYAGGFDEVPPALLLAAYDLVTFYYKRESAPRKSVGNQSTNNAEFSYSNMPPHIKRVLDLYRLIEF